MSDVPEKVVIYIYIYINFVQMAAIFNFTITAALPTIFSGIDHIKIPVHVS